MGNSLEADWIRYICAFSFEICFWKSFHFQNVFRILCVMCVTWQTSNEISLACCPEIIQIWKEFIRHVLKTHYSHSLLSLLASLVGKLYEDPKQAGKLSLERLYEMIVSHSKFLPSMLAESEATHIKCKSTFTVCFSGILHYTIWKISEYRNLHT